MTSDRVQANHDSPLRIAGRQFDSRLLVGTGKFASPQVMAQALDASGAEIVTVALRRVDIDNPSDDALRQIDRRRYQLLPNTSGARTADEAIRLSRLARAATGINWVKLEVTPDPYYLLPDPIETLRAAETLVAEGFVVLPYINADPILARRLEDCGTATVMPLGSPIGSNQGIRTRAALEIIIEQCSVPVVVDAGLGLPSHAAEAMEMGADAVLVNTAIATAEDPLAMAAAFKLAVEAGRMACHAGPRAAARLAQASSPLTGFLGRDE
ncbi:MAG: thiazole synthase [Phycisphaerae bacterium]|nr:thiazole synthase [Phycisphaerae bacterium]